MRIFCSVVFYSFISPAHLNANFATMTAMISLMIAAATIVPDIKAATDASVSESVVTAMPVNTRDTPEWGNNSVI